MTTRTIAVIGGSGLYHLDDLDTVGEHRVETPFGDPSDAIIEGILGETRLLFLSRHGRGHRLMPTEIPYRANVFAMKRLGAEALISVSAVGSLREDIAPGHLVIPDQYIDRTKGRPSTFFGEGIIGHVMFADPVCPELAAALATAAKTVGVTVHEGGTLITMEGPAFSTRAESNWHRQMGGDLIGMTAMPEAKLAREAELCYATLALATDYDCWHETEEDVTVEAVIAILKQNVANAQAMIKGIAMQPKKELTCGCHHALDNAIITDRAQIPADRREAMKTVFGRVLS